MYVTVMILMRGPTTESGSNIDYCTQKLAANSLPEIGYGVGGSRMCVWINKSNR